MLINSYRFGRLWTPADIATALWLDASDSSTVTSVSNSVSQWNDKSGNGRNATQSNLGIRPTYANSTVTFTAQSLNVPIAAAQLNSRSLIMVFQTTGTSSSIDAAFVAMQAGDNPELRYGVTSAFVPGNMVRAYWNGGYAINAYNGGFTSSFNVFASEFDGNTTPLKIELFKNGTSEATATRNVSAQGTFGQFTIGGYTSIGTANGSLKELLTYQTSATNRQLLEGYLAWKWGLTSSLPSDHPYKSAAPTV